MSKYAPLKDFLVAQNVDRVPMSFAEIETVLNLSLPASKQYAAWWSNNPSNNPMTREWLAAGFENGIRQCRKWETGISTCSQDARLDGVP